MTKVMSKVQVIVVALGSAGDVHPNIGLGLALERRGFDVLIVATEVFRSLAERAGLAFAGIGSEEEYEAAIQDPDLWDPLRSFSVVVKRLILPALRPVYEIIEKHHREKPTIVAAPAFAFGARIAQEKLGVPLASVHLQPILLRSAIQPSCFGFPDILRVMPPPMRRLYYRLCDKLLFEKALEHPINSFRAELGLPPVSRIFHGWVHSPQLVIGMFPDWYAPPPPDWPPQMLYTGFPLWDERDVRSASAEVEQFLGAGEPPLVFTAGSAMVHGKRFFEVSAEILHATGRRGILLTQFPEQLPGKLPAGVRHFSYIPFSAVLPRSAALVHHGGIGTAAQAMAAGIPQLIVPFAHDQPDNAVRIRRLGVGDYLTPRNYTRVRATAALQKLLDPAVVERCRAAAARIDKEPLDAAAALFEVLAAKYKTGETRGTGVMSTTVGQGSVTAPHS